eukprot:TRINITY_DN72821_c0_g1_i1.p1 TRINITY_DN72821_c0_g1~~TRINITY_DN72821_c0_g1_i1.p1  ORF type:complete len:139 (-),score=18.16 TRINITY_DN72821_c0_g1_i1:149-565(-)
MGLLFLLVLLPLRLRGASAACGSVEARANQDDGRCAVAGCIGDASYPTACQRVARFAMMVCPPTGGGATVSSNDTTCCCQKLCHMEWPNGTECLPNATCYADGTGCVKTLNTADSGAGKTSVPWLPVSVFGVAAVALL